MAILIRLPREGSFQRRWYLLPQQALVTIDIRPDGSATQTGVRTPLSEIPSDVELLETTEDLSAVRIHYGLYDPRPSDPITAAVGKGFERVAQGVGRFLHFGGPSGYGDYGKVVWHSQHKINLHRVAPQDRPPQSNKD